ncbi:hypothetical protein VKT23_016313 [Stygiomarasmius scandens]|uniref:NACHT domain-containing protein n=1 Tax=Marasmiellus scandens TaxID=2682957 RepID=A0ABR1IWU3_9AGAR
MASATNLEPPQTQEFLHQASDFRIGRLEITNVGGNMINNNNPSQANSTETQGEQDDKMKDFFYLRTPKAPGIFVGRDELTKEGVNTLCGDKKVHLAILGDPGIGKTSLALHIKQHPDIQDKFGKCCYFLPCDEAARQMQNQEAGDILLNGIVNILMNPANGKSRHDLLKEHLKASDKDILIILDNLETLWHSDEHSSVPNLINDMIKEKHVYLIVTMRERNIPKKIEGLWCQLGKREFGLPSLSLADAKELFYHNAPKFKEEVHQVEDLEGLLNQAQGIPLAIQLLARQADTHGSFEEFLGLWHHEGASMLNAAEENPSRFDCLQTSIELSSSSIIIST